MVFHRELLLSVVTLSCIPAFCAGEEARRGRFRISFEEKSPRSDLGKVDKAVNKKPEKWKQYEIADESFEVYVPKTYSPEASMGLLVWVSASDRGDPPRAWPPVFDRNRLIFVGANKSGNKRDTARCTLPLDAVHNMAKLYSLDEDRIYIAGASGGGRVASRLALAFGDVFDGGLYVIGCDYIKWYKSPGKFSYWSFPAPPASILTVCKEKNRYVFATGEKDYNREQIITVYEKGYKGDGFKYTTYLEAPGKGHENIDAEWLQKAVTALDEPLVKVAKSIYERAVSLEKRGRAGEAMAEYGRALSRLGGCDEARQAQARLDALKSRLSEELASARQAVENGQYDRAKSTLAEVVKHYGASRAPEAAALLKRIETDPAIREAIAASRSQAQAERREAAAASALSAARKTAETSPAKSYGQLRSIEKRYPGTRAAEQARAEADRLWADPARRRAIQATSSSQEARKLIGRARNFAANNMNDLARAELAKVIKKFPGSKEARQAQGMLDRLRYR